MRMEKKKVYLTLQNGRSFQGYRFGAEGEITGELVFSTGMVGYIETLTDPANYGQIVVQTFPLIGNYGMIKADMESQKAWMADNYASLRGDEDRFFDTIRIMSEFRGMQAGCKYAEGFVRAMDGYRTRLTERVLP